MAYPTPEDIDAAIPVDGEPSRALTNAALKSIIAESETKANATDPRFTDSRTPTGPAGGVLAGTYPNPSFAQDMASAAQLDTKIDKTQIGATGGVAPLDEAGVVPTEFLNVSGLNFFGAWDASTNTPELVDGVGTVGDFGKVSVAGTQNFGNGAHSFQVGDWVIYAAGTWQRIGVHEAVASVNGKTGAVQLTAADVGARPAGWNPAWADVQEKPDFASLYQPKHRGIYTPAIPALNRFMLSSSHTGTSEVRLSDWGTVYGYDQFGQLAPDGKITMPSWAKLARISAHIIPVQSGVTLDVEIRRGSMYGKGNQSAAAVTPIMKVSSTDIFEIIVRITSGAAVSFHTGSWLNIELYG